MRRILRIVILAIVAVVALLLVALATSPGRSVLAGIVARAASGNGLSVSIEGLSGWPPFWFGAERIILADGDGPFAEIDQLAVDPRLLALFTGSLAFDTVSAKRVAIERSPDLPGSSGEGALLPFAADTVSVARLELGADLAGHAAVLSLRGAASASASGRLSAQLDAERIDGPAGKFAATVERANGAAPLLLTVNLSEAADGILPGLMGRSTAPGYTLSASTSQDSSGLSGTVALVSAGEAHFDGNFTLSGGADTAARRIVVSGAGDLGELVPPAYADLLSGPINLAADADFITSPGQALPALTIRSGSLTTGAVSASASGALGKSNADLALRLDIASPAGDPVTLPLLSTPAHLDTVSLTGKVVPAEGVLRLDLAGTVSGLALDTVSVPGIGLSLAVEARGDDPLGSATLPFALRVEANELVTPSGRIAATPDAPLLLVADGTYDVSGQSAEAKATLDLAGGRATFDGTLSAGGAEGAAEIDFADLAPLSPLAGRPLAGALTAKANGSFPTSFTLEASADNLDPGDATAARLLAGTATFAAGVAFADGTLALSDARIDGAALEGAGSLTLAPDTVTGNLDGSIADLARLAEQSSGAATFTARLSGDRSRPTLDATVAVASGALLGQQVENAAVRIVGAPSDAGWQATLALDGALAGKPLAGKATASVDAASGLFALPSVDLLVGDNRITGAIERTAEGPLSGRLSVDAPNLATLAALALVDATGTGSADVQFAPDGTRQSIAVAFSGTDLTTSGIAAGRLDGEVHVGDAFGAPAVRGNASATRVAVGSFRLDTATVSATAEGGVTEFTAAARGPDADVRAAGSLSGAAGAQTVRVDTLAGTAFGLPVQLSQPLTLALGSGQSRISGATLALGGGSVRIDGPTAPQLDLTIVMDNVAASVANSFVPPLGAQGTISGRATVTGPAGSPAIAWQADWAGLSVAATRSAGLPGLALSARGNATLAATSLAARLSGAGLALDVSGDIPYSGPGLSVRAAGTAPLSLIALETSREVRAAGTARVDLSITGSASAPSISGTADLADAMLADATSGFGVTGVAGRIAFDGRRATIDRLAGRLVQGGDIAASGYADVMATGLPADLSVRITNGRYADGSMVNTTFNADLAVSGPLAGNGLVSGSVDLGRTEVQLPDRFGGSATAIDVRHVNAPPGFTPPKLSDAAGASASSGSGGGLGLDIALAANRGLFVRGFGIDAELGGTVRIAGTTGSPQAIGAFTQRRGRMEVLGRRFDFQTGTLTFAGDLVPLVDFAATTATTGGTVTLNVTGPANDPKISFTSSPSLPEEEILSRLLFDREVGRLSPLQAAQLVDAVAQLTGALGGTGMFARVRQATGLDDLDIRQSASGGTTVGVGKRINDNIRLGVEAGTDADAGRVVIDLDITQNLKARGEAGQDGSGKVGITYEREY